MQSPNPADPRYLLHSWLYILYVAKGNGGVHFVDEENHGNGAADFIRITGSGKGLRRRNNQIDAVRKGPPKWAMSLS